MKRLWAGRQWEFWVVFVFMAVTCGAAAWWRALTWLVTPDDEGTLIYSLRVFMDGKAVYNQTHSIYGPFWYLYECLPRQLFHLPVNHDTAHAAAALFWTAGTLAILALIYRTTESIALAAVAAFVGYRMLQFVGYEPAHPQAFCVLMLLLFIFAGRMRRTVSMPLFGVLLATAILTKLNFGAFLALAIAVVLAPALPLGRWRHATAMAVAGAAILFPAAMMSAQLGHGWAIRYAGLVMLSLLSAILVSAANRIETLSWRQLGIAAAFAAATAALIIAPFLMLGDTLGGIFRSMVLQGGRFSTIAYYMLDVSPIALLWAAATLPLAWMTARGRMAPQTIALLKLAMALAVGAAIFFKAWTVAIEIGSPMLWLVVVPGVADERADHFLRPLLAVAGVLQVLYAFPTAGSQAHFGSILIFIAAVICAADALEWFLSTRPMIPIGRLQAVVVALVLLSFVRAAYFLHAYYQEATPLALPGAALLHLEPTRVQTIHRLVAAARTCSMVVSVPGLPSLSLLSGTPAPPTLTGLNYFNGWLAYATPAEQEAAIREATATPRACAVFEPQLTAVWINGSEKQRRPLYSYVSHHFHEKFETGGYHFMVRDDSTSHNAGSESGRVNIGTTSAVATH